MGTYISLIFVGIVFAYYFLVPYFFGLLEKKSKRNSNQIKSILESGDFLLSLQILNEYKKVLSEGKLGEVARNINLLRNSKEEISKAFSVFLKHKKDSLSREELNHLKVIYSSINQFTDSTTFEIIKNVQIANDHRMQVSDADQKIYNDFINDTYLNIVERYKEFDKF
jgi:hypothetical protein